VSISDHQAAFLILQQQACQWQD